MAWIVLSLALLPASLLAAVVDAMDEVEVDGLVVGVADVDNADVGDDVALEDVEDVVWCEAGYQRLYVR